MSDTITTLAQLQFLVNELNSTNSKNEKIKILGNHPKCKDILYQVYNPFIKFGVSSKALKKRLLPDLTHISLLNDDIFVLLSKLSNRQLTGHNAIDSVNLFISRHKEYTELIYNIIDKNLKVRIDDKVINKVFPNLIPTFDVALADKYEKHQHKVNFNTQRWFVSRKLDGVRCLAIVKNNSTDIKFYSRQGNEFVSLESMKNTIREIIKITKRIGGKGFVLDGEMCVVDADGNENFKSAVSQIKRQSVQMQNAHYKLFDFILLEDFYKKQSTVKLSLRLAALKEVFDNKHKDISVLEQTLVQSETELMSQFEEAVNNGWEGLILREDRIYEGKRSRHMLKMKKFTDAEYKVKRVEVGPFRIISDKTGLDEEITTVTNIIIEHKGNEVSVGSGFSLDQRKRYYDNISILENSVVCVKYFEESKDKDGKLSLRFPTIKHVYENGRNI